MSESPWPPKTVKISGINSKVTHLYVGNLKQKLELNSQDQSSNTMSHTSTTTSSQPAQTLYLKPHAGTGDFVRPDIEWLPSYDTYERRVERLAALKPGRPNKVPEGWPTTIDAARDWTGSEFADSSKYVVELSKENILEIENALSHFKGRLPLPNHVLDQY